MNVYDIMLSCRRAGDECAEIQDSIDRWREQVTTVTARYGEGGGHGSGDTDKMGEYAAKVDRLLTRLERRKRRWSLEMEICLTVCDELTGIERTILYAYYAKAWTLDAIAGSAGFTPAYVRKRKAELDSALRARELDVPGWYEEQNDD